MADQTARIVIVGSGPGALEAALALAASEHLEAEVALVTPQREFVYRPNIVVEPFGGQPPARYLVEEIVADPAITQYEGFVERVDADAKVAYTPEGGELPYDALILATGARPAGAPHDQAITLGQPGSIDALKAVVGELDEGSVNSVVFAAPAGRSWHLPVYELALMTAERADKSPAAQTVVGVVTPEATPLEDFGAEHSARVARLLSEAGIVAHFGETVEAYAGRSLRLASGRELPCDRLIELPALRGNAIEGFPSDADGFVPVDEHQAVAGLPAVYAIGDVTDFKFKQGGLATREGHAAVEAIEAALGTRERAEPFDAEVQAVLLTGPDRISLRAKLGPEGSQSLPADEIAGPAPKIFGRLLTERLRKLSPLGG